MSRIITLVILSLSSGSLCAQGDGIHHFIAEGELNEHAVKVAHASLAALDREALLSFDSQQLKVLSKTHTSAEVLQALNTGTTVHYRMDVPIERLGGEGSTGFPVRINTGDPVGVDVRYQEAKQQWIDAHPQLYHQMLLPGQSTPLAPPRSK